MVTYELSRFFEDKRGIIGELKIRNKRFFTLEQPWIDNIPFISSIPNGEYACKIVASQKFGKVYQVQGVRGRTGILFHKGNYIRDTYGCILLGLEFSRKPGAELVLHKSQIAMAQFHEVLSKTTRFRISIND